MRGEKNTVKTVKRRVYGLRFILIAALCAACIISLFVIVPRIIKKASRLPAASELDRLWSKADYKGVYELSSRVLAEYPFQNLALTYRGYAAFFLALSQPEPQQAHLYIDTAVNSLRLALMQATKRTKPQIEYMLGKTYFQKNMLSAYHYYADSAVRYLTEALASGYTAHDIYEYLGLCYADLNMTEESIAAFTEALSFNDSDTLLLAIARQYYKNGQNEAAKPYLYRIKNTSTDEVFVLTCARLLGDIYFSEGNIEDARKEYEAVLKKDPNDADSYYGLGLIYEKEGDMIRARASWRKALKAQVNHAGALNKMDAKK
ncbi:tetratricopeptide repeat protein [Treponema sp. HNW]|uniref:tetratricopeptide repeat protein n=1 Tax=Treponema sp. HNW TaxID=3116654 RepID=UPI003D0AEEDA